MKEKSDLLFKNGDRIVLYFCKRKLSATFLFVGGYIASEDCIRNSFCTLSISLANQMRIHILRGRHLSVTKSFGNTDRVCTGEVQNGCHGVTELVCVNVRQIVSDFESF